MKRCEALALPGASPFCDRAGCQKGARGMSSLIEQCDHLFVVNRGIGQSRHEWKAKHQGFANMAPVTFTWASEKRYKSAAIRGVKWLRERDHIQRIAQITPAMITAYIAARLAAGLSPRTVATDVTALRRLGLYAVKEKWIAVNFVPADLSVPHGADPRYSYAPAEERAIIAHVAALNPLAADVLRVMSDAGLRIKEAIMLRSDFIDFERGTITVSGKGGKERTIEVSDRALLNSLQGRGRWPLLRGLANSWIRRVQALVRVACLAHQIPPKGTHGFRAAAAQRRYDQLIADGHSDRAARRDVSQKLGHTRINVTNHYAP